MHQEEQFDCDLNCDRITRVLNFIVHMVGTAHSSTIGAETYSEMQQEVAPMHKIANASYRSSIEEAL